MGFKSHSVNNIYTNRPTMLEYASLKPEVKDIVDYTIKESLRANPVIRIRRLFGTKNLKAKQSDFWNLRWADINEVREAIQEKEIVEVFRILYGITEKEFLKLEIFNVFAAYKWITEQLQDIAAIEKQELETKLSSEDKDAGAEALYDFGYYAAVDGLAKGDLLKHNDILQKKYSVVFQKMCLDKVLNDINKTKQENANRKNRVGRRRP